MKTKLSISAGIFLAMTSLTYTMESKGPQDHHHGISGQTNITRVLLDEVYVPLILDCPTQSRLQRRGVDKFTRNAIDKAHEGGKYLEELVFALVIHNTIYMELSKLDEREEDDDNNPWIKESRLCLTRKRVKILPKNIDELRDWCTKGYPFGQNETVSEHNEGYSRQFYSFWLFHYGVLNNCLPLVHYALDQQNNFWNPQETVKEMMCSPEGQAFHTHLSYIVDKDFLVLFDLLMKNNNFLEFSFGDCLIKYDKIECIATNRTKITHFIEPEADVNLTHMLEHGSKDLITWLLKDRRFFDMFVEREDIEADGKENLLVKVAKELGRPQEIIDIIENAIAEAKKTTITTEL